MTSRWHRMTGHWPLYCGDKITADLPVNVQRVGPFSHRTALQVRRSGASQMVTSRLPKREASPYWTILKWIHLLTAALMTFCPFSTRQIRSLGTHSPRQMPRHIKNSDDHFLVAPGFYLKAQGIPESHLPFRSLVGVLNVFPLSNATV